MDERGRMETGRGGDRMVAVIQRQTEQGRAREGGRERTEERGRKKEDGRKRTEERGRKRENSAYGLRGNKNTYICYRYDAIGNIGINVCRLFYPLIRLHPL